ncbi:MAG: HAMP domain-containing histidine kinase, partial [Clostridiales bacterium]|nr:HAMP domain-containing histidine kinase [Clostridiales bacterium]
GMVEELELNSDDFYNSMSEIESKYNINIEIRNQDGSLFYLSGFNELYADGIDLDNSIFFRANNGEDSIPPEKKPDSNPDNTLGASQSDEFQIEQDKNNDFKIMQKPREETLQESDSLFDKFIVRICGLSEEENHSFKIRKMNESGISYIVYSTSINDNYSITVSAKQTVIENNANIANNLIWFIALFVTIVAMALILLYSKRFAKPLVEMNNITRNMAKMDFSQKCTTKRNDEIGQLGVSINVLSDSLDVTLKDLQEKNIQLEKDIEFERKQESVRKEFISNVSHELKTPISIIQGYAEGLQTGVADDEETINEYCTVIMEETQKMNKIVISLLELSKYEFGAYQLNCESFDIKTFVTDYTNNMALLFSEKGIDFKLDIEDNLIAWADVDKLNMVLNNFVSNAVAHIAGEKQIKITAEDVGECYRVKVFNTGENISPDDMENIWISFYRADKSHSRSEGRYGIGLSIVKAIQNLHKQEFGCINEENGVTFWFDVKKNDADNQC